jgi:RNA polymerase sigma-70 factor (ECF subfamily)
MSVAARAIDMESGEAGERVRFEASYEAHRDRIYRLGLRYGGGRAGWAEDLTHDVFLKLWEHLPRLKERDDVGGWLYRVAANLAISRIRRERSMIGWLLRVKAMSWWSASEPDAPPAEAQLVRSQEAAAALAALRALPARERVAACMKFLDGKSQQEIAAALSLSEGYVSKLIARAVERLRAAGWEVEDGTP